MSAGALQKALFDLLSQDPALTALMGDKRVHDAVPKNRKFPFLVIGELTANDWSTSDELGQAFIVTLRVWSSAQGRKGGLQYLRTCKSIDAIRYSTAK